MMRLEKKMVDNGRWMMEEKERMCGQEKIVKPGC